jgi:motility quorum-sensing regulator / GCU-specific mRNA interferase toxin
LEKWTPHCNLPKVKSLIEAGKVRATLSAISGGAQMGFGFDAILDAIRGLTIKDFYKSKTTYGDHRTWQDVYRLMTDAGRIYLKLTVIDDVLIVSFKEIET